MQKEQYASGQMSPLMARRGSKELISSAQNMLTKQSRAVSVLHSNAAGTSQLLATNKAAI